jgi:hypothetical protein
MNILSKQQLMDRIIMRLQADSASTTTASSREITLTTTQLIDHARHLDAAFSTQNIVSITPKAKLKR